MGDPSGDVTHRCDLGEIYPHRPMPGFAHSGDMRFKQTALAKSAGGGKSNGDAIGGRILQRIELRSAVYELSPRHRALIEKRIHRARVYGKSVHTCAENPFIVQMPLICGGRG
jgi:hypothetical protein